MGSPGSGKTTVAALVGQRLGLPVIDIDDYLEKQWNTTVAEKVSSLTVMAITQVVKSPVYLLY
jgi:adenylate kinase family enzyme